MEFAIINFPSSIIRYWLIFQSPFLGFCQPFRCCFFSIFFVLLILFFVIFLWTPLSALSYDFVSYSLVVTCNCVITSTLILFKALFYSKVVNNWRSLTETFLLNFLSFLEVVHPRIFLPSLFLSLSLSIYTYM